jgi:hypothetical protein
MPTLALAHPELFHFTHRYEPRACSKYRARRSATSMSKRATKRVNGCVFIEKQSPALCLFDRFLVNHIDVKFVVIWYMGR